MNSELTILMEPDEIAAVVSSIEQLPETGTMVEWGSGGSTLLWLSNFSSHQKLISIEHNVEWYDKVSKELKLKFPTSKDNLDYILARPQCINGYKHGYATVYEEHPYGLENYIIPNKTVLGADLYFIDGVGRAAVAAMLFAFGTNPNSVFYLHDYWGREDWYAWFVKHLDPDKTTLISPTLLKFTK